MNDMVRRIDRGFGRFSGFIGRIGVAALLGSLSNTPLVENKALNNFLVCIAMLTCVPLWEQKHRMKALGGLFSAWAVVKVFQWNTPARWHYDIAFFVFLVLLFYLERPSASSQLATSEENHITP
jgi:hypothetical protein